MAGTRSRGEKIVFEHYDKLVQISGGSALTEPLSLGVNADSFSEEQEPSSSKSATSLAAASSSSSAAAAVAAAVFITSSNDGSLV